MTTFLRLLAESDKAAALREVCGNVRETDGEQNDPRLFEVAPEAFDAVPGKPFAYWVSEAVRETFRRLPAFESEGRMVRVGLQTSEDFRFVRLWWETPSPQPLSQRERGFSTLLPSGEGPGMRVPRWFPFAKGGAYSPFYADVYLVVNWADGGAEIVHFTDPKTGKQNSRPQNTDYYLRPGLTWPLRTQSGLSLRAMPADCIFGHKGPAAFVANNDPDTLLALLALTNSRAFGLLVSLQMAFGSYEVGVIQKTPIPPLPSAIRLLLSAHARRAWSLKRSLDTVNETSHAFLLPAALRALTPTSLPEGDFDPSAIEAELVQIQAEIDAIAFDLYGFSKADRLAVASGQLPVVSGEDSESDDDEVSTDHSPLTTDHLLSWAVGVAFGRFDWRLATGERQAPPEPEPFDPLPAKSPGMLPDGAAPFHLQTGILVDDPGHPHDLARLAEEVLDQAGRRQRAEGREEADPPAAFCIVPTTDTRRWLQRDFFAFHLQRYSKSRRKAPIYWPLATASGSYTLWVYYPSLSSQTLYTAINDFVEPKLKQVSAEISRLKAEGGMQRAEGRMQNAEGSNLPSAYRLLPALQDLVQELTDLRDTLLKLAPTYKPNHDDGVQITAAPLWPLFRHKPWQKVLKDTWAKLEKGDYDWAHLAMNYWPERVCEKCKTDKSLAIAHGLEDLYVEPEAAPKKTRGRKGN